MKVTDFQNVRVRYMYYFLAIIGLIFCFSLTSCETKTPSTIEPDTCEYAFSEFYNDYEFENHITNFVFVLVDTNSGNVNAGDEFGQIEDTIINELSPGDRLIIALVDREATTKSVIFDQQIEIIQPPPFPTKGVPPQLTPIVTSSGPTTLQGQQRQTSIAIEKKNGIILDQYYCRIGEWNYLSDKIYDEWEKEQQNAIEAFVKSANDEIVFTRNNYPNNDKSVSVYKSIEIASQILQTAREKREYDKFSLIIFSDMDNQSEEKSISLLIDLTGVDTFVINPTCKYEMDCKIKSDWENQLKSFGAISPSFTEHLPVTTFDVEVECAVEPDDNFHDYEFPDEKTDTFLFFLTNHIGIMGIWMNQFSYLRGQLLASYLQAIG